MSTTSGQETNGVNWNGGATSFSGLERPAISEIAGRLAKLREKVATAAERAGRTGNDVAVLLAAKFQEPERVAAALSAPALASDSWQGKSSPLRIGHNYIQQLEASEEALAAMGITPHPVHVIGHVQANKAAKAMQYASCIETVDSLKLAKRLDRLQGERVANLGAKLAGADGAGTATANASGPRRIGRNNTLLDTSGTLLFDVMIQVNAAGSESQFGVAPEKVMDFAGEIAELKNLRLTGLMLIGAHTDDVAEIAASHARVRELRDAIAAAGIGTCRELSMGMTNDMEIAIAEGSTQVRVGTAVFGSRPVMV